MKPARLIIAIVVVIALTAGGYLIVKKHNPDSGGSGGGGGGGIGSSGGKTLVIAIPTYPGFTLPYLAEKKGMYQGVKVELKRLDDAAATSAGLIKGDLDGCFTSVDAFVLAQSQGVSAKAVLMADESRGADGIVAKDSITQLSDLKGKQVAANLGWPGHFFLLYNLKKAGIPFSDVTIINMDADKAGSAFVAGKLDSAVTWEPWLSKATSGGNGHILVSTQTLPGVIVDLLIMRDDTVTQHPAEVQAFVNAYYRAYQAYLDDKSGAGAIMAEAAGLKPDEFADMAQKFRFIPRDEAATMLARQGAVSKLFNTASDLWTEAKVIDKPVADQGRVTDQFVRAPVAGK